MSSRKTARWKSFWRSTSAATCGLTILVSCKHSTVATTADSSSDAAIGESAQPAPLDTSADAQPPPVRTGMVWISPGNLRAGTPADHVPRIADEELAGVDTPMTGFY
ncbi:MAG: hypothetical protein ABI183_20595, partial [Polyangiaceae bacterium]